MRPHPTLPAMDARPRFAGLPYGSRFEASLPALHRAFLTVNRVVAVPALRAGLGPLFATPLAGSIMLLRTRGRRSGVWRDAPLGYVVRDGAVYCVAGFGRETHWFRNLMADARVECLLPSASFSGVAEEVTDEAEWREAYAALIESMGAIGRATVGDVSRLTADEQRRHRDALPLVRIRPTGIAAGPFDPGGLGWLPMQAGWLALILGLAMLGRRLLRR